nr:retrovirus-related Pol polyprotein from transposon TNT 1-94 [Tanacetum cinerariifolium]
MLLEGSELTKEDRESQLYDDFEHFRQHKEESIHEYYIRGLRDSNYDQLFAYLKQHEAHAKENKMMLERLSQPTADPLALLSNVSNTQHGSPSSSSSYFTQLPLPQPFPQTNNQLRTSSNPKNQATVQDDRVVVQNVQGRPNRGQGMNPRGGSAAGYEKAQNRVGNVNQGQARPGQARTVKCYNCNDKMPLMQTQENGVALDAEQLLFLAGGPDNAFDDDVDKQPVQDLALNVDNVFQAEDCDAFDSNVQDHDQYLDDTCAYQEEHVMHDSVPLDHFVDLHADYTSVSNMILYDQYVKDNEVPVVYSNASFVQNDTFIMIYNDMCEPSAPSVSNSLRNEVVKNSLTTELATYREQVELPLYNDLNKVAIGYKNPLCLTHAKQDQPALYNGHEILKDNHAPAKVHNAEDTLEIAEITRKKMNAKMTDPECVTYKVKIAPHDYTKENFLATFTPQKQLTLEQIYWSNDLMKLKFEALKEQTKISRPIKAFTVKATVNPQVSARDKHAIDVEPIVPRLRNNRDAHLDYLRHVKESVETIRDIVEEAKVVRPLDRSIISACRRTDCPLVFGFRLLKTYDGGSLTALEFHENFIGTVRFGNDHFGAIMGYEDYVVGKSVISRVYYVEGLGHNLFSVGQFCDSNLEVTFKKHPCYVRDTDGVDLIKGSRGSNLYTISVEDMMKSSPICLLSKASKNKSWLWHRHLNHLNFGTINDLVRKYLVRGLPRLKFEKDHLCSACQLRKSKKHTHKPKAENTNLEVLNTLHMELCGPMRTPAQAVQALVTLAGTPLSTTIDQDAPSPHISPSSSALQSHSLPPGVVAEPHFMEDHNIAPVDNNPFVNVFAPEPHSEASSSGDISSIESPYVSQSLYHLNKWSKDHLLDNVIGNPSRPVSTQKQLATDALCEVVTDAVDWAIQAPLRNRFRDLPEADMKEILHHRMWESDSYKSHEDHMQLFEALEKSMNRDHL